MHDHHKQPVLESSLTFKLKSSRISPSWYTIANRLRFKRKLAGSLLTTLLGSGFIISPVAAQDTSPHLPCGDTTPWPPYPAVDRPSTAPAIAKIWQADEIQGWIPPACTGWAGGPGQQARTVVALAGRFWSHDGAEQLIGRFGAITTLPSVRYWSTSDKAWRPLVSSAWTLDGPNLDRSRADFTATELIQRRQMFFAQRDSRSSGTVIYSMRLLESTPDRIVFSTQNVTPIRMLIITLFQPGALQTTQILQRISGSEWGYYSLTRTLAVGSSSLASGHPASYINRASALFYFIAKLPGDTATPLAH